MNCCSSQNNTNETGNEKNNKHIPQSKPASPWWKQRHMLIMGTLCVIPILLIGIYAIIGQNSGLGGWA